MPPTGFTATHRTKEDIIKGALILLRDYGPSGSQEILCTQEATSKQTREIISFMQYHDLVRVVLVTDQVRKELHLPTNTRAIHFITERGSKYLSILQKLDALLTDKPGKAALWHAGNRGISQEAMGKAQRMRNLSLVKKW